MSVNWDSLIKGHFKNKNKINFGALVEMVSKQINDAPLLKEAPEKEEFDLTSLLPPVRISEAWGQPGHRDKEIASEFASKIEGTSIEEKLKNIAAIVTGSRAPSGVGEILATLVMLETLNVIAENFTQSAGGFVFEGFLAGLFGVSGKQMTSAMAKATREKTGEEKGLPITDIDLNDIQYSLKLLSAGGSVEGSWTNIVEHFSRHDHVIYLDTRRVGGTLEFGEFTITLENFTDIFVKPFLGQVKIKKPETINLCPEEPDPEKPPCIADAMRLQRMIEEIAAEEGATMQIYRIKVSKKGLWPSKPNEVIFELTGKGEELQPPALEDPEEEWVAPLQEKLEVNRGGMFNLINTILKMDPKDLQEYAPFDIQYTVPGKFKGSQAEILFGDEMQEVEAALAGGDRATILDALRKTPGYKNKEQFSLTRKRVQELPNFENIATIPVDKKALETTWLRYAELLDKTLRPVYSTLGEFTGYINAYFLGATGKEGADRASNAEEAKTAATKLRRETVKAIKIVGEK